MFLNEDASVTITHSKCKEITKITSSAEIIVAAVGKPNLIKKNWIKKDAIIIDVGINKVEKNGANKLVGDVDFNDVKDLCQAITPVPGGVGPVTIAMLMSNTFKAYSLKEQYKDDCRI